MSESDILMTVMENGDSIPLPDLDKEMQEMPRTELVEECEESEHLEMHPVVEENLAYHSVEVARQ